MTLHFNNSITGIHIYDYFFKNYLLYKVMIVDPILYEDPISDDYPYQILDPEGNDVGEGECVSLPVALKEAQSQIDDLIEMRIQAVRDAAQGASHEPTSGDTDSDRGSQEPEGQSRASVHIASDDGDDGRDETGEPDGTGDNG